MLLVIAVAALAALAGLVGHVYLLALDGVRRDEREFDERLASRFDDTEITL